MKLFNTKQDRAERVTPGAISQYRDLLMPGLYCMRERFQGIGHMDEFDMSVDREHDRLLGAYYNARTQSKVWGTLFEGWELARGSEITREFYGRFQAIVAKLHDKFRVAHYVSCEIREPGLTARIQANTLPRRKGRYRKGSYDHRSTIRLPRLLYSNPAWTNNGCG